jgi:hypothetical protein
LRKYPLLKISIYYDLFLNFSHPAQAAPLFNKLEGVTRLESREVSLIIAVGPMRVFF